MARRRQAEKPAESNRGRRDARGVFVVFDREREAQERPAARARRIQDEPLTRDDDGDRAA